jgi:hypothetical protein
MINKEMLYREMKLDVNKVKYVKNIVTSVL